MALIVKNKDSRIKQFPNSKITAIIDGDYIAYKSAAVGDEHYIEVLHTTTGKVKEFKNVTEFKGRGKVVGGWLGDVNSEREAKGKPIFSVDAFTIESKVRRKVEFDDEGKQLTGEESLRNILYSAKSMLKSALEGLETDKYVFYIGGKENHREDISTLMRYKGSRINTPKPLLFKEVREYLIDHFNAKVVTGIEVDDKVIMDAYGDNSKVVVAVDKDALSQPVRVFNPTKPDKGIIDCDCFGELTDYDSKTSKANGYGRIHLYYQMLAGDTADEYKANCMSDVKYGHKSAYDDLHECKDDKEALTKVIEVFKKLYPEAKVVESWRGQEMMIDFLSVAREQFKLVSMLRFEGDSRTFDTELALYEVEYEY
jgi:hypothetical protein